MQTQGDARLDSPLLPASTPNVIPAAPIVTPLPKLQLATLCLIRLAEPIAFTQIFPYINQFLSILINKNGVPDPRSVAVYSGVVESAFALAQLSSIYQWARLSGTPLLLEPIPIDSLDVIGRKPVIISGVLGLAFATILFGLSTSLSDLVISRCLAGLFSGTVAALHSVLGELTDDSNQSIAFPIYGLIYPLGVILGPLIGGTLSNINVNNNSFISLSKILHAYPYFLPCAVSAAIALISGFVGWGILDETLPAKRMLREERIKSAIGQLHIRSYGATGHRNPIAREEEGGDSTTTTIMPSREHDRECGTIPTQTTTTRPSVKQLWAIPVIRSLCLSGFALSFVATGFDVVFVLFCYASVDDGGLGFSANQIGVSLSLAGIISILIQVLVLPGLLRGDGTDGGAYKAYRVCMWMWVWAFAAFFGLGWVAGLSSGSGVGVLVWIGVAVVLVLSRIGCLAYSIAMVLVKENAPGSALGSANGLTQFTQCLARAIAPIFVSSAFAMSMQWDFVFGGYAWVLVMMGFCVLGCWVSRV